MRFGILLLIICFASCQKKAHTPPYKPQTIRTCLAFDVSSLDPRKGVDVTTQGVVRMLFAGLAYLDHNLIPKLDLAEAYRVSDDFKTYTFFLRDCTWSDGSPITARDFEETWKAALTPAYSSPNTNLFYFIKNARKAFLGAVSIDQVGIRALDDKTLRIELEKPTPHFLNILINSVFSPVHESMRYTPSNFKKLISSGPFRLKKYIFQNQIVLEKNPAYWEADKIRLEQIQYFIVKEPATSMLMYEKGEIDWLGEPISRLSPDAIPHLHSQGVLNWMEGAGSQWLYFNTKKFPFNNVNIRKAFAYALDRKKIMQDLLHLENPTPPLGLIPKILKKDKWHPWFEDHDVRRAKECFAQGLKELEITAEQFPEVSLIFPTNPLWSKVLQAVQQMWAETLGVRLKIESTENVTFVRRLYNSEYEIARWGWIMQYDDPANLIDIFKLKNLQPNFTGWENPEYIRHAEAFYTSNEQEKWEHIEAAEKIFFDEMPSVPISDATVAYLQKPYVKGVHLNYLFQIDFRWAYIDTEE